MSNPQGKNGQTAPAGQVPRYKILAICHLNDRLYDPSLMPVDTSVQTEDGEEPPLKPILVSFTGIPGPHLEPVNDAAREMVAKHADRMLPINPIAQLPIVGADQVDPMQAFAKLVAKNMIELQKAA